MCAAQGSPHQPFSRLILRDDLMIREGGVHNTHDTVGGEIEVYTDISSFP